jgi:phosphate transport system substrate-binding protein
MTDGSIGNVRRRGTAIGLGLVSILALSLMAAPAAAQQPFVPQAGAGATPAAPQANVTLRPELYIVGASTMKGYIETTARHLTNEYDVAPPKFTLLGTTAGIQEFCGGLGPQYPDIVAAYRGMHKGEFDTCIENGVLDIIEVKIGLSALYIVMKKNDPGFDLTPRMFYNAFAAQIPEGEEGEFHDNPNKSWRDVNRLAPDLPIRMLLPGKTSGTRFVFDNLIMQAGCRRVKAVDKIFAAGPRVARCTTLRADHVGTSEPAEMRMDAAGRMQVVPEPAGREFERVVFEIDEPYGDKMMELLARSPPGTIAVMAGEIFDQHYDEFQPLTIGGYLPVDGAIERFDYDIATPNFFYFKRGHMRDNQGRGVVRGIREFMQKLTSEELMGRDGIFVRNFGLVPLNRAAIETERAKVRTLKRFVR